MINSPPRGGIPGGLRPTCPRLASLDKPISILRKPSLVKSAVGPSGQEHVPEYNPEAVRALNWRRAEALSQKQQRYYTLFVPPTLKVKQPPLSITSSSIYSELASIKSSAPDYSIAVKVQYIKFDYFFKGLFFSHS